MDAGQKGHCMKDMIGKFIGDESGATAIEQASPGLSERNPGFHTWGMQPRVTLGLHPGYELLLRLIEVSEVGGTLALLCGHDETLGTQKVRLTLDPDVRVVLRAVVLDPPGLVDKAAAVVLGDGPGTHQGVVEHGDFIV